MRKLELQVQMTIFKELDSKQNLTLVKSTSFDCGIVVLNYEPKRG